jgi:hypothetical protein
MMSRQRHLHHLLVLVVTSLWSCIHADFRFISYEGESLSKCSWSEKVTSHFVSVGALNIEYRVRWPCVISGFRREVEENFAILGYWAASSGSFLLTFRDNLSVPYSGVENKKKKSVNHTSVRGVLRHGWRVADVFEFEHPTGPCGKLH